MKNPTFLQHSNKLYTTTVKTKPSHYANYACDFYFTRKEIVRHYFQIALEPLIIQISKHTSFVKVLDVGCGDGVVFDALYELQKRLNIHISLYGLDID